MGDRVRGKAIIVTGAGSIGPGMGNGKAASILYAREGGRVLLVDRDAARRRRGGGSPTRGARRQRLAAM